MRQLCACQCLASALKQRDYQQASHRAICKLYPPELRSGKQGDARLKSSCCLKFAPLSKSISPFKTQILIVCFLGEGFQYIPLTPHLEGLIFLCILWLDWCCEPRTRSRRNLCLQMLLLETVMIVGLSDIWLLQ